MLYVGVTGVNRGAIYKTALESIVIGLLVSIFMAYVALDHNPQDRFYDTADRAVVAQNLLEVMGSWFLSIVFYFALLRTIVTYLLWKHPK